MQDSNFSFSKSSESFFLSLLPYLQPSTSYRDSGVHPAVTNFSFKDMPNSNNSSFQKVSCFPSFSPYSCLQSTQVPLKLPSCNNQRELLVNQPRMNNFNDAVPNLRDNILWSREISSALESMSKVNDANKIRPNVNEGKEFIPRSNYITQNFDLPIFNQNLSLLSLWAQNIKQNDIRESTIESQLGNRGNSLNADVSSLIKSSLFSQGK